MCSCSRLGGTVAAHGFNAKAPSNRPLNGTRALRKQPPRDLVGHGLRCATGTAWRRATVRGEGAASGRVQDVLVSACDEHERQARHEGRRMYVSPSGVPVQLQAFSYGGSFFVCSGHKEDA
jgi:hypothetical protein